MQMLDRNELHKLAAALGGLPVLFCRPGSPAEVAGVRYGDIVLAVNGIKTPDWATFIEARGKSATKMELELFREGETVTIEFPLSTQAPIDPPALLAELIAEQIVPLSPSSAAQGTQSLPKNKLN
jgi:predicted metalloprotease with PDZ domain